MRGVRAKEGDEDEVSGTFLQPPTMPPSERGTMAVAAE